MSISEAMSISQEFRDQFGSADIYLLDQIARGRFDNVGSILDAGCGSGRNLHPFWGRDIQLYGIDRNQSAIDTIQRLAADHAPSLPPENFVVAELHDIPLDDKLADAVICSAVLHFASGPDHFGAMLEELWRVLRPGGLFFARLASTIGLEVPIDLGDNRRAALPDGSNRFLVDIPYLQDWTARLGGELLDPIKTTNVQNLRCMTTWVMSKGS